MKTKDHNTGDFPDLLTENNYRDIEREFLKYTNDEHYDGAYEFTKESGLMISWGKYDYNVPEPFPVLLMEMLYQAMDKFNKEFIGRYIAFGEIENKFNSVSIHDLQQICNNKYLLEKLTHVDYKPYQVALQFIENKNKSTIKCFYAKA